ncbi:MAG TPA: DNA polymerase III subunit delta' [bacterium]
MAFDNIIGQQRVKLFFERALASDRLSHAYLFVGDRGVGKEAMALEWAKALLCSYQKNGHPANCADCNRIAKFNHPDVHFLFPAPAKAKEDELKKIISSIAEDPYNRLELWANPSISIERIREIRQTSAYKSFEGQGRVVIVCDCERMTIEAANALLKILEEPPPKMYIIMISSRPNLLLPTITSRCQLVKFDPLAAGEIEVALAARAGVAKEQARLTARLASGSYRRALELLDENLQEMQSRALEFFRKSVQNEVAQVQFIEEVLIDCQRDLKKIRDLLILLALWLRDAMLFGEGGQTNSELLINYNQSDVFKKFVQSCPQADLFGAVGEIEKSLQLMDRNVQINLILIVLMNKLRTFLRR